MSRTKRLLALAASAVGFVGGSAQAAIADQNATGPVYHNPGTQGARIGIQRTPVVLTSLHNSGNRGMTLMEVGKYTIKHSRAKKHNARQFPEHLRSQLPMTDEVEIIVATHIPRGWNYAVDGSRFTKTGRLRKAKEFNIDGALENAEAMASVKA